MASRPSRAACWRLPCEEAAAIKVNVGFFEAFGSAGWAALERLRAEVPPELILIADAKRGDIGSSAERYAAAILGHLGADGVTVSPYLGEDGVAPFVEHGDAIVYVLARTSNPSAGTLQDLVTDGAPLHEHVARWVGRTWPDPRVGIVVGATAPAELERLRSLVPRTRSWCPESGRRAATSPRRCAPARQATRPVSSTCHALSPAPPVTATGSAPPALPRPGWPGRCGRRPVLHSAAQPREADAAARRP